MTAFRARLPSRAELSADPGPMPEGPAMPAAVPDHAPDVMLDAVRLVEAVLHGDPESFSAVLATTAATPPEMVLGLATILAVAAAEHDDPDEPIRRLRCRIVRTAP